MRRAFDALAEHWDQDHGPESVNAAAFAARTEVLRSLLPQGPRCRMLDIGCGTGQQLRALIEGGGTGVGIDLSPQMVAVAKSHAAKSGLGTRLRYDAMAAEDLPVAHVGRFDLIYFAGSLEHMREPASVLASARHLLKPDGCVVVFMRQPRPATSKEPAGSPIPPVYHLGPAELQRIAARAGLRRSNLLRYWPHSRRPVRIGTPPAGRGAEYYAAVLTP